MSSHRGLFVATALLALALGGCGAGGPAQPWGEAPYVVGHLRAGDPEPDVVLILQSGHAVPVASDYLAEECGGGPYLVRALADRFPTLALRSLYYSDKEASDGHGQGLDGLVADLDFLAAHWPDVRVCAVAHSHGGVRLHQALQALRGAPRVRIHHAVYLDTNSHLFRTGHLDPAAVPVDRVAPIFTQVACDSPGAVHPTDSTGASGYHPHLLDLEDVVPGSVLRSLEVRLVPGSFGDCGPFTESILCPLDNHWNVRPDGTTLGLSRAVSPDTHASVHLPPAGAVPNCLGEPTGVALETEVLPWLIRELSGPLPSGAFGALLERSLAEDARPRALAVADLDEDGLADLVVGLESGGTVLLRGSATGMPLGSPVPLGDLEGVQDLLCADFDRDGNVDVASVSPDGVAALVSYGGGDGTVVANRLLSALPFRPQAVASVDLDRDDNMDLLALGESSLWWSRNPGPGRGTWGTFALLGGIPDSQCLTLVAEELDGDGVCDLVIGWIDASSPTGRISVIPGRLPAIPGDPMQFGFGQARELVSGFAFRPQAILCTDADGDGVRDLIVGSDFAGDLRVLLLDAQARVTSDMATEGDIAGFADALAAGDLDGDGRAELVTARGWGVSVYARGGVGIDDESGTPYGGGPGSMLVLGDFDGDGLIDLASAAGDRASIGVRRGLGVQAPSLAATPSVVLPIAGDPATLEWSCSGPGHISDDDPTTPDIGAVAASGSRLVQPPVTTVYMLTCGGQSVSVMVTVAETSGGVGEF